MTNESQPHEVHPHEVQPEDLTLYALGSLDAPELARVARHLEGCSSCRLELQKINADLGALAMAAAPSSAPPQRAKDRLMAALIRDPRPIVTKSPLRGWSFGFRAALALLLLAAVILGWNNVQSLRRQNAQLMQQLAQERAMSAQARMIAETITAPDAMKITLVAANSKPQPMAHIFCSEKKGRVVLMANSLAPLGPGKMYELWLLPKSGAPVPAGMFQADAAWNAQMVHEGLPQGMEAKGFAVTIEPPEGSPAPTTDPVLVGNVG